jgi:hypothetical protein
MRISIPPTQPFTQMTCHAPLSRALMYPMHLNKGKAQGDTCESERTNDPQKTKYLLSSQIHKTVEMSQVKQKRIKNESKNRKTIKQEITM